jgi:hypothetical protein
VSGALLLGVAGSVAVAHTAIGIDHVVPFVVLSRVQGWSLRRTLAITALCGVGHVLSAVALAGVAVALGLAAQAIAPLEALRGKLAVGLLVGFGLAYAALGAFRAVRRRPHRHAHVHAGGLAHTHSHGHDGAHVHPHGLAEDDARARARTLSTWTLFVVLVFGPCEALVPLLLAPGVAHDFGLLAGVLVVFGTLTILTMLVLVTVALHGLRLVPLRRLTRPGLAGLADVAAGLAIAATGAAVGLFGL